MSSQFLVSWYYFQLCLHSFSSAGTTFNCVFTVSRQLVLLLTVPSQFLVSWHYFQLCLHSFLSAGTTFNCVFSFSSAGTTFSCVFIVSRQLVLLSTVSSQFLVSWYYFQLCLHSFSSAGTTFKSSKISPFFLCFISNDFYYFSSFFSKNTNFSSIQKNADIKCIIYFILQHF